MNYETLPPEDGILPDAWVIIEFDNKWRKVLAGWSGGYLTGDSWRMSSPIKTMDFELEKHYYTVTTESGSVYILYKNTQGLRMSNAGIWNELKEKFGDKVVMVDL